MRYNLGFREGGPVLSGSTNGRAAFANLIRELSVEPAIPQPLFIDFKDVNVATASYLRESIFALKSYLRASDSPYYPVAANVNDDVYEELLTVANAKGDAILTCILLDDLTVSEFSVAGQLDPKQQMTFDLVHQLGETDAARLMDEYGEAEQTKSTTAWNNRLAGLTAKGIIREFSKGRAKSYRPILEVTH